MDQNEIDARAKEAVAAREDAVRQEAESLEQRLATPMTQEEAQRAAAEIDMREARLLLAREQVLGHLNEVDQQLAACRCARAEIGCRLTVPDQEAK